MDNQRVTAMAEKADYHARRTLQSLDQRGLRGYGYGGGLLSPRLGVGLGGYRSGSGLGLGLGLGGLGRRNGLLSAGYGSSRLLEGGRGYHNYTPLSPPMTPFTPLGISGRLGSGFLARSPRSFSGMGAAYGVLERERQMNRAIQYETERTRDRIHDVQLHNRRYETHGYIPPPSRHYSPGFSEHAPSPRYSPQVHVSPPHPVHDRALEHRNQHTQVVLASPTRVIHESHPVSFK